jgi:RecA-family ATPase
MQLAAAKAANRSKFLERKIEPGSVLLALVEDDDNEVLRRLEAIRIDMGLTSLKELDELHILNLCGHKATLWMGGAQGSRVTGTQGWGKICSLVRSIRPTLVGLDPKANLFLGQDLDRGQATAVVNDFLRGEICMEYETTVILCEHPSQSGAANRTGDFGSGGWTNSMRARQFFERIKNKKGDEEDADLRTLTSNKPNYGAKEMMRLRWHMTLKDRGKETGVFRLDGVVAGNAEDHKARVDGIVFDLVRHFNDPKKERDLSPSPNSANYFGKLMKRRDETASIAQKDLENAMERLLDRGEVEIEKRGKGRDAKKQLVPKK